MSKINLEEVGFGTRMIHAGQEPDALHGALATPIYQTSTFCFDTVEEGTAKFCGEIPGFCYSRGGNPTVAACERKIAALEGGEACVCTASGMGAVGGALLAFLSAGDHVLSGACVYGCTDLVIRQTLSKFGIEAEFVDTVDLEAVKAAIKPNTKVIYLESVTNPTQSLTDIEALAKIAHEKDIKLIVDNTFAPPPQLQPLKLGADIVLHSVTKYINGHGDVIAGAIVGNLADITHIRKNFVTKVCGTTMSPMNAFLVMRGMQTMELRMERHCKNGMAVAEYLENNPYVEKVFYPGLKSNPQYELANKMLNGQFGGIMAFTLKDGIGGMDSYTVCKKVVNAMTIPSIAVSLGDPGTLIQHPASMTHANVSKEDKLKANITDDLIRLSVGLENIEDLINDFEQAFAVLEK